jgi:hypothetical protein
MVDPLEHARGDDDVEARLREVGREEGFRPHGRRRHPAGGYGVARGEVEQAGPGARLLVEEGGTRLGAPRA